MSSVITGMKIKNCGNLHTEQYDYNIFPSVFLWNSSSQISILPSWLPSVRKLKYSSLQKLNILKLKPLHSHMDVLQGRSYPTSSTTWWVVKLTTHSRTRNKIVGAPLSKWTQSSFTWLWIHVRDSKIYAERKEGRKGGGKKEGRKEEKGKKMHRQKQKWCIDNVEIKRKL